MIFLFWFNSVGFFPKKTWNWPPLTVTHGKGPIYLNAWPILKQKLLLKHLYILVIWGKKEGKYMIKKNILFFLAKHLFWLCKWSVFRVHQQAVQREKLCFIICRCFAVSYSWRYIFVYPLYTWHLPVFVLSYVLNNNPHITYRFCEIKATLIVGREVTKGWFVNLCTSFCSFNPLNLSVALI